MTPNYRTEELSEGTWSDFEKLFSCGPRERYLGEGQSFSLYPITCPPEAPVVCALANASSTVLKRSSSINPSGQM